MLNNSIKRIKTYLLGLIAISFLSISTAGHTHSMVAQHGTLNFIDNHVFLLLSLPASAFKDIDDNKNGLISLAEFNQHRTDISVQVNKNVYLSTSKKNDPIHNDLIHIEGLLINPSIAHNQQGNIIDQITVMGRYTITEASTISDSLAENKSFNNVTFTIKLFGKKDKEKTYEITASNKKQLLIHKFQPTPEKTSTIIFDI